VKGAPPTKPEAVDQIWAIIKRVDERGRAIDERWGCGRLPTLVPVDWAAKFASQSSKFNHAIYQYDLAESLKHGEAMIRAYDRLEALAIEAGASDAPPDQWEFETDDGLVILIRDKSRLGQVQTRGRKCQVWSLDEIASVIRNAKIVAECKMAFPGAELVETRPARAVAESLLNDDVPFL